MTLYMNDCHLNEKKKKSFKFLIVESVLPFCYTNKSFEKHCGIVNRQCLIYILIFTVVKPVLRDPSRVGKMTLLTQVNYSEKCVFGALKAQSFNTGGL